FSSKILSWVEAYGMPSWHAPRISPTRCKLLANAEFYDARNAQIRECIRGGTEFLRNWAGVKRWGVLHSH
ncbi:MAG: hypothetical protein EB078_11535, partial [Proteobacteria bacterium]|nr:hypothetical protein [Pseudomonadota bacterium]